MYYTDLINAIGSAPDAAVTVLYTFSKNDKAPFVGMVETAGLIEDGGMFLGWEDDETGDEMEIVYISHDNIKLLVTNDDSGRTSTYKIRDLEIRFDMNMM